MGSCLFYITYINTKVYLLFQSCVFIKSAGVELGNANIIFFPSSFEEQVLPLIQ